MGERVSMKRPTTVAALNSMGRAGLAKSVSLKRDLLDTIYGR